MIARHPAQIRARRTFLFAFCLLPFALVAEAFAQSRLEGRVVDPQGRPVPDATIVAVGLPGASIAATTDDEGRFSFDSLAEGRYDLTVSAPGLVGEARGIATTTAARQAIEIVLRVSAVTESLIVSAAQVDQPLSRTADSVTVIAGRELEARQITSLGAALRSVPGFTVAQSGGPGTLTSLFPRGGDSDYTLVLIDGIRANAFGGGLDLSQVPVMDVERIEVVRGPQSAIYGADAIGGVVQIVTRRGGSPAVHGMVEGGSRRTRRLLGTTAGELGPWNWQGGGDYFEDEGFTGTAPANGEQVTNDDARQRQGWIGAGWRLARGTDLQGTLRYVDTERGAPGPFGSDPADRFAGVDRVSRGSTERWTGGVRLLHPWTGPTSRIRQRVEVDVADLDLSFLSAFGVSESETHRRHGRIQTDAALNAGFGVSAGVEWLKERARSTFITAAGRTIPVERRVIGTFGEARWNALERVSVQAGIRAEHIRREALAGNSVSARPDFDVDTVTSVNPKAAVSWLVSPSLPGSGANAWTRIRLAGGTGIRPPDAFEIAFTDNPNLAPERSRSIEIGVSQAVRSGAMHVDATAFLNRYDDLIVSVGSLRDVSRYRTDNVSNARARGLEAAAAWQSSRGLGARVSYTLLDTEIRAVDRSAQAPSPYRVGDALLRRPRHQAALNVEWTMARGNVFADVNGRGAALDAEPAFGPGGGLYENAGFAVFNAGGSFRLVRGVDVFARVLNLFDRAYEEVLGFPAPGRMMFAGIRLAARR